MPNLLNKIILKKEKGKFRLLVEFDNGGTVTGEFNNAEDAKQGLRNLLDKPIIPIWDQTMPLKGRI
jgi:hypothetical protein